MEQMLNSLPEFILFGSVLFFWVGVTILLISLLLTDYHENGYMATFLIIVFLVICEFWSSFHFYEIFSISNLLMYLGIGLIHSLLRAFFYGRKQGIALNKIIKNHPDTDVKWFNENTMKSLKGNVFRWWFLFPISFIIWVLSDIIKDVYNYLFDKFKNIFEWIVKKGINSVKI